MSDQLNAVRDRIVELRRVPASDLRANPRNWRIHPTSQARALRSVLDRVGYAGALLARETPEGLELIDGHLRADIAGTEEVPVLVLDVDDEEAGVLLAALDPIGGMAGTDPEALGALLDSVQINQSELEAFIVGLLPPEDAAARMTSFLDPEADAEGEIDAWHAPAPDRPYFTITVTVTAEDRDMIRRALDRAKEGLDPPTTQAALVAICRGYLEEA